MTYVMFSSAGFLTLFLCQIIPGSKSRNFPLENCSTEEMDILFLLSDHENKEVTDNEEVLTTSFIEHISSFSNNEKTPRVIFAAIYDTFSDRNNELNISSWSFNIDLQIHRSSEGVSATDALRTLHDVVKTKIQYVQRLFSEKSRVRENVTHIAVIFLNGKGHTIDEVLKIPETVQQQDTHIKICIVIVNFYINQKIFRVNDILILRDLYSDVPPKHTLAMAICNQCPNGWFKYEHPNGADYLSCYLLSDNKYKQSWNDEDNSWCKEQLRGFSASIETEDELRFLRSALSLHFKELINNNDSANTSPPSLFQVYIGLKRDTGGLKRFKWISGEFLKRPLVINNWMQGQPSVMSNTCAMWQFVWKDHTNSSYVSDNGYFVDGWQDVDCDQKLRSFGFCETVICVTNEEPSVIRPASEISFNRALSRINRLILHDNIVSISSHIIKHSNQSYLFETNIVTFPVFDCGENEIDLRYLPYTNLCDNVDDCNNRRDETFCLQESHHDNFKIESELYFLRTCSGILCCDGTCLPMQWVNDGDIDCTICLDGSSMIEINDEAPTLNKYLRRNITCAFICNHDTCVTFDQLNDGKKDCLVAGPDGQNENLDETIGKLDRADTCYNLLGHVIWAPRCVYLKDHYGAIIGCRDVSHLKNCTECVCPEGYFKCPNNYCIPQHYVLDHTTDCPRGEDEKKLLVGPCTGNFKCSESEKCLHPDLVCDGHPECELKDDELDCDVSCTDGFYCVSGTVTVSDYNRSIPLENFEFIDSRTRYMDLSGINLSIARRSEYDPPKLRHLKVMKLSNCYIPSFNLISICKECRIYILDISYNLIKTLYPHEFYTHVFLYLRHLNLSYNQNLVDMKNLPFKFLEVFDLSHTSLTYLDKSSLIGLSSLKYLKLSHTLILDISNDAFPAKLILQTLDLRASYIKKVDANLFNGLTITQSLYTDNFEICCPHIRGKNIPSEMCHSPDIAISSCFNLVGDDVQRVLLWLVATSAVFGNLTLILFRFIRDKSVFATGYGLFVTNLGISDFIMGVYLCIIAVADYKYRDVYVLYDKIWRESLVCKLAGFLATLSMETSTYFIFLITLDRFLIMKFPFGQIKFSNITKTIALLMSWIIGFLLALIPAVFKFDIYSSNAMCLGLPLTTQRLTGWGYSFAVFIAHNFFMFLLIAYGQTAIFRAMAENRISNTASITTSRLAKDILVAKHLSRLVLVNFLCWFLVGILELLTICGHEINIYIYSWITVVILPINSAANPLIYTIPVILNKWEKFNYRGTLHSSISK